MHIVAVRSLAIVSALSTCVLSCKTTASRSSAAAAADTTSAQPATTSNGLVAGSADKPCNGKLPPRSQLNDGKYDAPEWLPMESAFINPFGITTKEFPATELAANMVPGSDEQKIPQGLQGIWWMDGNPAAKDGVVSFAKAVWDFPNHRFFFQEFGPNNMSNDATDNGKLTFYGQVIGTRLALIWQFNDDYTCAQLINVNGTIHSPVELLNYQIEQVSPGNFVRKSWIGPKRLGDYYMRRIIDGDGHPVEPHYSRWLALPPAPTLFITTEVKMLGE